MACLSVLSALFQVIWKEIEFIGKTLKLVHFDCLMYISICGVYVAINHFIQIECLSMKLVGMLTCIYSHMTRLYFTLVSYNSFYINQLDLKQLQVQLYTNTHRIPHTHTARFFYSHLLALYISRFAL